MALVLTYLFSAEFEGYTPLQTIFPCLATVTYPIKVGAGVRSADENFSAPIIDMKLPTVANRSGVV